MRACSQQPISGRRASSTTCRCQLPIDEPEFAQFLAHAARNGLIGAIDHANVFGRISRFEITPTLERAARMSSGRNQLPVDHDAATGGAVIFSVWPEVEHLLAYQDKALDYPIKRTTIDHLLAPLRHLQRAVAELGRLACMLQALQPLCLPRGKLLDGVDADAKLDEMDGHCPLNAP